jgi:hypothetical protein
MRGHRLSYSLLLLVIGSTSASAMDVSPASVQLIGPEASQQLLVSVSENGQINDATHSAQYESLSPQVVSVDPRGRIRPVADGQAQVRIRVGSNERVIPVQVSGVANPRPISFAQEIIPVLTKATCNSGGCHGKAEGQQGFKLSVFGFDARADYEALVAEGRGRRIFLSAPEQSLILTKGTGEIPHGGGKKLERDSLHYRRLTRWLREGARYETAAVAPVVRIEIEPRERVLGFHATQQLRVTAIDANGQSRCVTAEAEFDTNASQIAAVDGEGRIRTGNRPGEAAILARYMGQVTVCRVTIPRPGVQFPRPPEANFIDKHVHDALTRLGIPPSEPAPDAMFLRRVYLDTIGTLPTAVEARAFLDDPAADKRARLIDQLLNRPEHADLWALKWADILRVDKDAISANAAVAMTRWLREQIAENRPYDQFARAIITAQGDISAPGPAALYKTLGTPEEMARSLSQVFLGVRIECAQCHHHPSDKWGQEDYFALAGLFSGVTRKNLPGGSVAIVSRGGKDLSIPRLNQVVAARPLGAAPAEIPPGTDRREWLADWMTAPDNPYFARMIVNRLWAHYFGRGLIEPLDDLRATNPASNEPLLDALVQHLRELRYDVKAFTRTLLNSQTYQRSSQPLPGNADDEQNFSRAMVKPMTAEVLLDAICQVTGVPEKFNGWPEGYRAIQVWDNRMPSYFFRIFGRPVRFSVCECERGTDPSIAQALHLMNSPEITAKIRSRRGMARKLAESELSPAAIIEELFLASLSRRPTEDERATLLTAFTESDRRTATEDTLWAILNSKEFLYNR